MKETNSKKEEWNKVISAKLKEGVTIQDLSHTYPSGIVMEPNVMKTDLSEYTHTISIDSPWINMVSISKGSSAEKNKLVLQSLMEGANGLDIHLSSEDSISAILKDVLSEYLQIRIDGSALSLGSFQEQISSLPVDVYPNVLWIHPETDNNHYSIGIPNRIEGIHSILKTVKSTGHSDIFVDLSKNMFFEIACLRALRALLEEKELPSFNIYVHYSLEGSNQLGDYNLIEKTYKVLSGILGGANAIVTPYNGDEDSRLTLNIHNILDLESGMKNVMDPLSGSYYIEKLTGEIIRQVKS
ncbi:MAG: methylmalonyl-CoA mutase family protein [Saprospiraceae bacterium]|nr:methylmalonyl-CoA mutase family protein [Saprospiraceae bacterium]